jgi:transcription termination factor Rho
VEKALKVIDIYPISNNFWGVLKIEANKPIVDKIIHITSDADAKTLSVLYVSAHSYDYVYSTIRAFDASSIDVVSHVTGNVHTPKEMAPVINLIDVSNISDQVQIYRVVFDVTATNYPAKNIRIDVASDIDSISYTIADLAEHNTQTNQVLLKSTDAKSVHVNLTDYDPNY